MIKFDQIKKFRIYFIALILTYLLLGWILLSYYRYQINPDGISYISIAQKYLSADFCNAINGWWGPMISWLLSPLLAMKIEPLLAAKILNLIIGVVAIIMVRSLLKKFSDSVWVEYVILLTLIPIILSFAMGDVTPDLLLMTLVGIYLYNIFDSNYTKTRKKGWLCGFWGGLGYLTKSYAFPFFTVHFLVMNVLHYFRIKTKDERKTVLVNFLSGLIVFAIISGIWVGLISKKYGEFTFGTSGKTAFGSQASKGFHWLGVYWQGFLEPSNETAISVWEDPSYLKVPPKESITFRQFILNQWETTSSVIVKMGRLFLEFSVLSVAVAVGYLWFWIRSFKTKKLPSQILFPTITIVIFASGYSLITVNARYIWILFILVMLMGGYLLSKLFEVKFFDNKMAKVFLLTIFLLSFAVPQILDLKKRVNRGKWVYGFSQALSSFIKPQSHIAANTNWPLTLYLAYHLDCRYYGVQEKNITRTKLKSDLEKYDIDYYFVWGDRPVDFSFLTDYREITGGRIRGLKIYGLNKGYR
ncbi:MAG: glycosyltransferase family 39 protein [Planctomycetota bacterium]|jgi:hypothetical protein